MPTGGAIGTAASATDLPMLLGRGGGPLLRGAGESLTRVWLDGPFEGGRDNAAPATALWLLGRIDDCFLLMVGFDEEGGR